MIVGNQAIAPTMSGVGTTAKATIQASARLFSFFSDMVYADKFVAIWRELVANGVDSHKMAKNKQPVEITLPTTFTPYAKVRDFGTGMDHVFLVGDPDKQIQSKFMAFAGESDKQLSNDQIGGFSIGSKAPLSYTEQYSITSFMNGVKRVYSVFKDAEGCPAIAFLSETNSDEPTGVEISFPVEQKDIQAFHTAAHNALVYFNPLPILKGTTDQLKPPEYLVKSKDWGFRAGTSTSQIVMGGVAYPIDKNSVPRPMHDVLDFGIDFAVPIGTVGVALSREALSYTEGTINAIGALCEQIRPKIQDHVNAMFASQPTLWDAVTAYNKSVRSNNLASTRLIESLAHYEGKKLARFIEPTMADKVLVSFITGTNRWAKHGRNSWSQSRTNPPFSAWIAGICPMDIQHVLIDDSVNKPILRCRAYLECMKNTNDGVMIVRKKPDRAAVGTEPAFVNDLVWDDFIKAIGSPKVIYLSTIEPAVVTRNGTSLARVEKIRGYKAPRVNGGFVDELPAGGGFYVEMENFSIKGVTSEEIQALDKGDKPLFYFNKGDFEKVKKNPLWVSAKSAVDEQIKTYRKKHKLAALADAFASADYGRLGSRLKELMTTTGFTCPKRGPLAKFNTLYNSVKPELTSANAYMRRLCKIDSSAEKAKLNLLVVEIRQAYPEMAALMNVMYSSTGLVSVYNKLVK